MEDNGSSLMLSKLAANKAENVKIVFLEYFGCKTALAASSYINNYISSFTSPYRGYYAIII